MDIRFVAEPADADFGFIHEQSAASVMAKYGESTIESLGAFIFSSDRPSCSLLKSGLTA